MCMENSQPPSSDTNHDSHPREKNSTIEIDIAIVYLPKKYTERVSHRYKSRDDQFESDIIIFVTLMKLCIEGT